MGTICKVVFKALRLHRKGEESNRERKENSREQILGNNSIKRIGRKPKKGQEQVGEPREGTIGEISRCFGGKTFLDQKSQKHRILSVLLAMTE